jgi:hypothetical protein
VQEGVRVDRDGDRRRHRLQGRVQSRVLARDRLDDTPVVDPELARGVFRQLRRLVRRSVVGEHHLDGPAVRQVGEALERRRDRLLLVEGRDQNRDRRPAADRRRQRQLSVRVDEQREDHEPDHEPGDVREHDRDHPRHDRTDRLLKLVTP